MNIKDRINFTHSALTVGGFCGYMQRGGWWMQHPGDIKIFGIFYYIKRGKNVVQI